MPPPPKILKIAIREKVPYVLRSTISQQGLWSRCSTVVLLIRTPHILTAFFVADEVLSNRIGEDPFQIGATSYAPGMILRKVQQSTGYDGTSAVQCVFCVFTSHVLYVHTGIEQ